MPLTPDQREQIRQALAKSILAFKGGWMMEHVLEMIEETLSTGPSPDRRV